MEAPASLGSTVIGEAEEVLRGAKPRVLGHQGAAGLQPGWVGTGLAPGGRSLTTLITVLSMIHPVFSTMPLRKFVFCSYTLPILFLILLATPGCSEN